MAHRRCAPRGVGRAPWLGVRGGRLHHRLLLDFGVSEGSSLTAQALEGDLHPPPVGSLHLGPSQARGTFTAGRSAGAPPFGDRRGQGTSAPHEPCSPRSLCERTSSQDGQNPDLVRALDPGLPRPGGIGGLPNPAARRHQDATPQGVCYAGRRQAFSPSLGSSGEHLAKVAGVCPQVGVRCTATYPSAVEHLPQGGGTRGPHSSIRYVPRPQLVPVTVRGSIPAGPLDGARLQAASCGTYLATEARTATVGVHQHDPEASPKFWHQHLGAGLYVVGGCILHQIRAYSTV